MPITKSKKAFKLVLFSACIAFTTYHTTICIKKFISVPKGIALKYSKLNQVEVDDFPAISICGHPKKAHNVDHLKKCNISSDEYRRAARWVADDDNGNENCTDPKKLFDNLNPEPSALIKKAGIKQRLNLDYKIHYALEIKADEPCTNEKGYNEDSCTNREIEKSSIHQFNCTTPFGPTKNRICTNQNVGKQVFKRYKRIWKQHESKCKVPCRKLMTKTSFLTDGNSNKSDIANIAFHLRDRVEITEEYLVYTGHSLIAEVGGYVGLFLGWSVLGEISTLAESFWVKVVEKVPK